MSSSGRNIFDIPGDYQHRALYDGPKSQRRWHQQKIGTVLEVSMHAPFRAALDAGCGSGIVATCLAEKNRHSTVVGLDQSESAVRFCERTYCSQSNLSFIKADLTDPCLELRQKFEFVYSTEVIEHLTQDQVSIYLRNLHRSGSADCRYFLSTPDYSTSWTFVELCLDTLHLTPAMRGHQHLTRFTPKRLQIALEREGFHVGRIFGFCGFGPLLSSFSEAIAAKVETWENRHAKGFLIGCEFSKR